MIKVMEEIMAHREKQWLALNMRSQIKRSEAENSTEKQRKTHKI